MKEYESLQYKTRGNASPQGRPRVFFCCAAADFDRLFEPVTEELLTAQPNAAIWYLAPGEGAMAGESFLADLSQMQLLVVPVTTAFLRQDRPDPARTVAFRYAVERHIPVLPLVQEPGLGQTFNELCGDLQYLDKTAQDPTAIPYEEKLRRFLEGVLVSDALAKRVRAAFDAYIFLSYRKKDRAAAQKLMRLIHENEFCRDVAIWYDEFLTPGENFNRAIEEAMKKSALFALVVTPNLLEDPNYVLTTEYPAAKRMEKKLLPFEAEPTDFGELARLYDGVREVVPTGDPAEISRRLRALLFETALRKNDDPAHTFLMGVAYLSGIDIEVNHARAVQLITAAAEAGLPEAMEKLVSMYKTGEGVGRSNRDAIEWQRRLAKCYREEIRRAPSAAKWDAYCLTLMDLGDNLHTVGDYDEAEKTYKKLLRCAQAMKSQAQANARHVLFIGFNMLGDLEREQRHPRKALDWYRKCAKISAELVTEQRTVWAMRNFANSCDRIGDILRDFGRPEEEMKWYRRGLEISERIAEEIDAVEVRRDLAVSYEKVGDASRDLGRPEEALAWYRKDMELSEAIFEETRTVQALQDLIISYGRLCEVCIELKRFSDAYAWSMKHLDSSETLARETGTIWARHYLSIRYGRIGDANWELGQYEDAHAWYQKGREILEALRLEADTTRIREQLAFIFERLGTVCFEQGSFEEALTWQMKSMKLKQELAEETNTVKAWRDHFVSCSRIGDAYYELGRPQEALGYYLQSVKIAEALADEVSTIRAMDDLSAICYVLGSKKLLPRAEREAYLRRALQLCEQLLQKTGLPRYQDLKELITQALASL